MKNLTIANHFVVACIQGALREGYSLEDILEGTGIPSSIVNQPMARVYPDQFTKLIQRVWVLLEDELMGFGNQRSLLGTFAVLCQFCLHSPNLEVMLKRMSRFYNMFEDNVRMTVSKHEGVVTVSIENPPTLNDSEFFLHESLLVIWHRTACWMVDQRINLLSATFSYPEPDHADEYASIFYCPLTFDSDVTSLSFSEEALKYPVTQNEVTLKKFLQSSPADLLARPTKDSSYTGKIRSLIGRDIEGELPSFEDVADKLHMTPQTLRRRLKAEKTSYQELKDNIRRDIAIHFLSMPDIGVNDIALKVGFTEPSTFHRAFKKWTGVTPSIYRNQITDK